MMPAAAVASDNYWRRQFKLAPIFEFRPKNSNFRWKTKQNKTKKTPTKNKTNKQKTHLAPADTTHRESKSRAPNKLQN